MILAEMSDILQLITVNLMVFNLKPISATKQEMERKINFLILLGHENFSNY